MRTQASLIPFDLETEASSIKRIFPYLLSMAEWGSNLIVCNFNKPHNNKPQTFCDYTLLPAKKKVIPARKLIKNFLRIRVYGCMCYLKNIASAASFYIFL